MKRLIPLINGSAGPIRSSTTKNMDTFFNALVVLIGFGLGTIGNTLISAMGRVYYRMTTLLFGDPAALIATLKRACHWYIQICRGARMDETHPFDGPNDFFGEKAVTGLAPNSILWLRNLILTQYPSSLDLFDQVIFALLSMHRLIVIPPVKDLSTITEPSTYNPHAKLMEGSANPELTDAEIRAALHSLGIKEKDFRDSYRRACKEQTHVVMSSAGPNGKASWSAYSDAIALMNERPVLSQLITFAEQSGLNRFIDHLFTCVRLPGTDVQAGVGLHSGKIHTFEEWGGKTRNVAIVDYWTQLILTPLHNTLFSFLKSIPMDATFNQDAAAEYIRSLSANENAELYSVDLSAATDRLPASLQVRILKVLLGNDTLAVAWAKIFTERSFKCSNPPQMVKYAVGLPMGSKSNWAMLALTHHIIIKVAALRAKLTNYNTYRVCGDDSSFLGNTLFVKYTEIMAWYGVPINRSKSIMAVAGLKSAAEFCKRVFVNGVELTTIPVKLIVKTVFNGRLLSQLQNELHRRRCAFISSQWYDLFAALVDRESLEFIMLLNACPQSINGLLSPLLTGGIIDTKSNWFGEAHKLTDQDIVDAYTYVLVTDQLKRLDALLRQTEIIAQAIEANTGGFVTPQFDVMVSLADGQTKRLIEVLGWKHPELSPSHPIVYAAFVEIDRVNRLLASLRSGDSAVSAAALNSMLDGFRNALVDSWNDEYEAKGQAERSLITKAMSTLADIISQPTLEQDKSTPRARRLDFTISLAYVRRIWTVSWVLGQRVTLNAVKSKVITSTVAATTRATEVASKYSLVSRFGKGKLTSTTSATSTPEVAVEATTPEVNPRSS
uniref:RNA-dependent RNA polymerase n=1 Tax=Rhizophagus diaphanum mitovirus 4 TaxID=2487745 RepID=A0A3Q8RD33_9VIRU|nr:RNA-dependent RNA polymerase [Rhizophagus diaphanum mitovirus 4]